MFLPFEAKPKLKVRDGTTLDPKKINASLRQSAQEIKAIQAQKYSYSVMQYHLEGMDLKATSEERRFIVKPPADCEIIGAHLSCRNLADGVSIFARWLAPSDVATGGVATPGKVMVVSSNGPGAGGSAAPVEEDVEMPSGVKDKSFKYIEATGEQGFVIAEAITQQNARLNANDNYVLEMGCSSDAASYVIDNNSATTLTLWMRSDRGTDTDWNIPELLDGSDVTYATNAGSGDPKGIEDLVVELRGQASQAISAANSDTIRCDVIKCNNDTPITPAQFARLWAERIPRMPTLLDNGRGPGDFDQFKTNCKWSLYRVDFALVSDNATFCAAAGQSYLAELVVRSDGAYEPPTAPSTLFYSIRDPLIGDQATGAQYKEVYVKGHTADGTAESEYQIDSDTLVAGNQVSPLNPAHDLYFNPQMTVAPAAEDVKLAYMYVWYRLDYQP